MLDWGGLKIYDIAVSETEKGHEFIIQTSEDVDDVLLIYTPGGAGDIKAAYVLPGERTEEGLFIVDFDYPWVLGNARVLAFRGDVGIVADYHLGEDWASQDYKVPPSGGRVPQLNSMSMHEGFELSVSESTTLVEFVIFPEANDPTSAIVYLGYVGPGEYRIEFSNSYSRSGFFLIYNLANGNNVVLRSEPLNQLEDLMKNP